MIGTSLLTERDPFPMPLYEGEDRVRIIRYLYIKDLEKLLSPYRYKNIKELIKTKSPFFLYSNRGCNKIRYKSIKI